MARLIGGGQFDLRLAARRERFRRRCERELQLAAHAETFPRAVQFAPVEKRHRDIESRPETGAHRDIERIMPHVERHHAMLQNVLARERHESERHSEP